MSSIVHVRAVARSLLCWTGHGRNDGAVYVLLGYANGAQIWAIEPHGEAWEVYSSRQGPVKHLRLLPFPEEGTSLRETIWELGSPT